MIKASICHSPLGLPYPINPSLQKYHQPPLGLNNYQTYRNVIVYVNHKHNIGVLYTYTVGTYSPGKLSVVYEISIQVFPTVPSPTTTHFIGRPDDIFNLTRKS